MFSKCLKSVGTIVVVWLVRLLNILLLMSSMVPIDWAKYVCDFHYIK